MHLRDRTRRLTALLAFEIDNPAVGVVPDATRGAVAVVHPPNAHGAAGVDAVVKRHRRRDGGALEGPGLAVLTTAASGVVCEELAGR